MTPIPEKSIISSIFYFLKLFISIVFTFSKNSENTGHEKPRRFHPFTLASSKSALEYNK